MKKPIIGIACNTKTDYDGWYNLDPIYFCKAAAADVVLKAGGLPVVIPTTSDKETINQYFEHLDGLIIQGGDDVNPAMYDEDLHIECGDLHPQTDIFENLMIQYAFKHHIPTVAMCRGVQMTNVALGGSLYQDVNFDLKTIIKHHAPREGDLLVHDIMLENTESLFSQVTGVQERLRVNSIHHQSIKDLAQPLKVVARANDGVIEIIELKEPTHYFIGTQFHPEILARNGSKTMLKIYEGLVKAATEYSNTRKK